MSIDLVPASVRRAARRAFIRTTSQAYAATIPTGGVSAAAILSLVRDPDPLVIAATVTAAVLSPPLAGAAAYLGMIAKGIPDDYTA